MATQTYNADAEYVYMKLRLDIREDSYNKSTNKTSIYYRLYLYKWSAGGEYNFVYGNSYSLSINGKTIAAGVNPGHINIAQYGSATAEIKLTDGYMEIAHNSDGTKSFPFEFSFNQSQATNAYYHLSGTHALTSHSRYGTLDSVPSSANVDGLCEVKYTPPNLSYEYELVFKIGSQLINIYPLSPSSTSQRTHIYQLLGDWWLPFMPNKSEKATVTLNTYQSGKTSLIGSSSKTMTVKVPSTYVPGFTSLIIEDTFAGHSQHGWLQNLSKIKITVNPYTANGAWVKSVVSEITKTGTYKLSTDGALYMGTSATIPVSGTVYITTTITDSRGFTATKKTSIKVKTYNAPSIDLLKIVRCTEDKTVDESLGKYALIQGSVTAKNIEGNKCSFMWKRKGAGSWHTLGSGTRVINLDTAIGGTFAITSSYTLQFRAVDTIGGETIISLKLPKAWFPMEFRADGEGVAFGKIVGSGDDKKDMIDSAWGMILAKMLTANGGLNFELVRVESGSCKDLPGGIYYCSPEVSDTPDSSYSFYILKLHNSDNYEIMFAVMLASPRYLYTIKKVGGTWQDHWAQLSLVAHASSGISSAVTVPAHSYSDTYITYDREYESTPHTTVGLDTSGATSDYGLLSVAVFRGSGTKSGFTARVFNDSNSSKTVYVEYTAYGV